MKKTWAIIRREFLSFVGTKMFLLGTIFGPVVLLFLLALPILLSSSEGGQREIAVVVDPESPLGREVATLLAPPGAEQASRFRVHVVPTAAEEVVAQRARLRRLVALDSLDGYVLLPGDLGAETPVRYEGRNVADFGELGAIQLAVQRAVQERRLAAAGIDPRAVERALEPVPFDARALGGEDEARGTPDSVFGLLYLMSFGTYMVILLYGISVLRSVQEEKDQRVVEILLSSVRPRQLMQGKVLGIGVAGLLQVTVWVAFAAVAIAAGPALAETLDARLPELPRISLSLGVVYVFFFLGGYFLYAALYAALGAIATSSHEASQLQYPALVPLMVAFFSVFAVMEDPGGALAVAGSLVPFTSPLIFPVRWVLGPVPWHETALAVAFLALGVLALLRLGGAVFRVTILATGSRPSWRQIARWMRAA